MHRHGWIDGQHIGPGREDGDRHKVFDRIIWLFVNKRIDGVRYRDNEKRIAVGCGFCGDIRSDDAAGAGAIVDEDGLSEFLPELIGDDAADHVIAAAWRKRNDQPDRTRRVVVRGGRSAPQNRDRQEADSTE